MKTIIEMAREAGFAFEEQDNLFVVDPDGVCKFAELVLAAERNHIAGVFEDNHEVVKHRNNYWLHAANYVRGRGNT